MTRPDDLARAAVSSDGNALYAYKACFGDPSGCVRRAGTLRYGFDTARLELADDGSGMRHCEIVQGDYPGLPGQKIGPCPIEERALPTRWTRVERP